MKIEESNLPGVFIVSPEVHEDERGAVFETFRTDAFSAAGIDFDPAQLHSVYSKKANTVRGLNFQLNPPMAKYVRVSRGSAFLVAVDVRADSPNRGKWFGVLADDVNRIGLYAPASFARGMQTLVPNTVVEYASSAVHAGGPEQSIRWNDPAIGIEWPLKGEPIVSAVAAQAPTLAKWLESHSSR